MFIKDNLTSYLIDAGLNVEVLIITEVAQDKYTVTSPDAETTEKILEQVDRDEEHPVTMNGVEVLSKVVNQDDFSITIGIEQLTK